jgi:hypothetical protein
MANDREISDSKISHENVLSNQSYFFEFILLRIQAEAITLAP